MASKLAWATALILIVAVVGVGAWAIFGQAPAVPPSAGGWSSIPVLGMPSGSKSGIVAVYVAKPGQDYDENWSNVAGDNYYLKHTATGGTGDIPYETDFVILVEVVGHDDNMAYVNLDNLMVELGITGSFTMNPENSGTGGDGVEYQFALTGTEIGVNAVWDNNGNYFKLPAGGSITYTTKLWLWG